jgi:hypothetical protein
MVVLVVLLSGCAASEGTFASLDEQEDSELACSRPVVITAIEMYHL